MTPLEFIYQIFHSKLIAENELNTFLARIKGKEEASEVVNVLLEIIDSRSYNYYDNLRIFLEQNDSFHIIYARWKSFRTLFLFCAIVSLLHIVLTH